MTEEVQTPPGPVVERTYDPEKIRVLGARLLVRLDEGVKQIGSIIVPDGSYERCECWATVIGVGTGIDTRKGRIPLSVKKGDRILVIRMHELTSSNEKYQALLGDRCIFIGYPGDVLAVQED